MADIQQAKSVVMILRGELRQCNLWCGKTAGEQLVGLPRTEVDMEVFGDPPGWHWVMEMGYL